MKIKKSNRQIYSSIAGILLFLLLLIILNSIVKHADVKIDVTQDKLFTLSDGTQKIIDSLEVPVTIRFYVTEENNTLPSHLRNYSARVEDMLSELKKSSNGKIKVVKYDPEQDSDEEEYAELDGLVPQQFEKGENVYFGLSFTCLDNQLSIPFLLPEREEALEYEIMRRISEVSAFSKPVIGMITSLPILGGKAANAAPGGDELTTFPKWIIREELEKKFDITDLEINTPEIPENIRSLIILHPTGLNEIGERAVDKFVQRGGKLFLLLDPACMTPELLQYNGNSQRSSSAPNLLHAWGISYNPNQIVTDWQYGTSIGSAQGNIETLTVLSINADGLNQNTQIIGALDYIALPFAGAMKTHSIDGLKITPLISSSKQSSVISTQGFQPMDETLAYLSRSSFISSGESQLLAVQVEGKFPSAFNNSSTSKTAYSKVIVFLDTDFIYDFFAVRKQTNMGETEVIPINGNFSVFMNALAVITNNDNLSDVRNRELIRRPFLRIERMESAAREAFKRRISEVEGELRDVETQLEDLQNEVAGITNEATPSVELKYAIKELKSRRRELHKQLKSIRLQLRRDIHQLENRIKWINIGLMPFLIIIFGTITAFYRKRRRV